MIGRGGFQKRFQVTAVAFGREALAVKLPYGSRLVTRIAVDCSVCTDQRKTILMLIDGLDQNLPASYAVTEVALCSIFPPVNVGMTILTIATHIGEYRADVAFLAGHVQMQAAQWIASFVVIEIELRADWFPCRGGVTFLASHLHRAMRTPARRRSRSLSPGGNTSAHLEQQERLD